jgi:polyhydroxyalkanoate synthase
MRTRPHGSDYLDPDRFQKEAPEFAGSWWTAWEKWLADRSTKKVAPPKMGAKGYAPLGDAPGEYVLQR